jgi:hypothetical protein
VVFLLRTLTGTKTYLSLLSGLSSLIRTRWPLGCQGATQPEEMLDVSTPSDCG